MTLENLNNWICGGKDRCWMIFNHEKDMSDCDNKIAELWTPHTLFGNNYDKWTNSELIKKQVKTFRASGWQANVYYVVLK